MNSNFGLLPTDRRGVSGGIGRDGASTGLACAAPTRPLRQRARRRQRGLSLGGLLLLAIVLGVFALPAFDGKPLVLFFADAVATGFARFLASISLPV